MSASPPVDDPSTLSVKEVYELFLDAKKLEYTDETLRDYESRLKQFVQWADERDDIETIGDITGWHLEQFRIFRQGQDLAPTTVKGQMQCMKIWLEYAADIEAVDEMLPYKVTIPKLDQHEETDDTLLEADAAEALIEYYRESRVKYASEEHIALELTWYTGARLGGIRALDLDDYSYDEEYLRFRHHPDSTPLKKKQDGERAVAIPSDVCEVLDAYIQSVRTQKRDDYGRDPLLCARQGRPALSTIQNWVYHATIPCRHSECPHDKTPATCGWTNRNDASQCPSSRSPHQVRTGSITWQLNKGLSFEEVAERVNSDPDTLRRYYDKASDLERMELRRRQIVDQLDFDTSEE